MHMRIVNRLAQWTGLSLVAIAAAATITMAQTAVKAVRTAPARTAYYADTNVSIMTEALSSTAGSDEDSVGELARAFASAGLPRILPVRGLGPIANMRDLLHMRGIDMAVVDADILAYARATGELPGAETRLSAVARLYDKTVFVVAAPDIASLSDLANQRVLVPGADSDSFVSARTVFSQLSMKVELVGVPLQVALADIASGKAKAILLTLEKDDGTLATLAQDRGLHILPIPENQALSAIYGRRSLGAAEAPGLVPEAGVSTLTVSSLLATFNWRPTHLRYAPILQLLQQLPKVVDRLRTTDATGLWREFDGRADVPGWLRYEPARPLLASILPQVAPLTAPRVATAAITAASNAPAVPTTSSALADPSLANTATATVTATAPAKVATAVPVVTLPAMAIEVAAHPLAVLADPDARDGGLMTELVMTSLKGEQARLSWSADPDATGQALLGKDVARVGLPFARPDCEHPASLTSAATTLCDRFAFSKPIFQALQVFFVRHGSDFTFERDDQVVGRSVCAAENGDVAVLDAGGRKWLHDELITLLRRPKLAACLTALDKGEVDAVLADDLAGRVEIERQQLDGKIEVVRRPVATLDMCAIAEKANAGANEALRRLDQGIAALKADGRYASIVLRRLGQQQLSGDLPPVQ